MLHVNDLTYRIGDRVILDAASFAVPAGARVGVVGRNGAGKTTLFRIVQGEVAPEGGAIGLPRSARIGAVAQEAPSGPERLVDVVLAADAERTALLAEAAGAEGLRRAEIETRLADIGAHAAPARAAAILHGLGFDAAAQERPCSSFSGGWRMRVALAAVLFAEPDLLLLDEPTNYLDLEGTLWLYDYLGRYPHTVFIISHDRELLDTAVDHILHLERGKLTLYRGGYTSFARQLAERQALQSKLRVKQEAERRHLQAFVDRFRAKASKARQAQSRLKRLARLEPVAAIVEDDTLAFDLPSPARPLAPPLVAIEGAAAGYDGRAVLDRLNLTILPDDRIALLGANGNGKSTFCKLVGGRLAPLKGEVRKSAKIDVAYFAQHQLDELRPSASAFAHVAARMPDAPEAKVRARCGRLRFSRRQGGHARLRLVGRREGAPAHGARRVRRPAHAHPRRADQPSRHRQPHRPHGGDQRLRGRRHPGQPRPLPDRGLRRAPVAGGGRLGEAVRRRHGRLPPPRAVGRDRAAANAAPRAASPTRARASDERRAAAERRVALAPLRKRLEALEARMEKLTGVIAKVDAALADGAFQKDPAKASELARMRAEAAEALAGAEEEWLTVGAELEEAQA